LRNGSILPGSKQPHYHKSFGKRIIYNIRRNIYICIYIYTPRDFINYFHHRTNPLFNTRSRSLTIPTPLRVGGGRAGRLLRELPRSTHTLTHSHAHVDRCVPFSIFSFGRRGEGDTSRVV
jgi:hypothetical protein